jgi:hypothetical protein
MFRPLRATLNPAASAGPLLGPHQLHFSREAGSFFGHILPFRRVASLSEEGRDPTCSCALLRGACRVPGSRCCPHNVVAAAR